MSNTISSIVPKYLTMLNSVTFCNAYKIHLYNQSLFM